MKTRNYDLQAREDADASANSSEPVARVNNDGFIVETGLGLAPGTLLYAAPQQAGKHGVSPTQVLITMGKVIAGYRPGGEGWSEYDQQVYDVAMSVSQPTKSQKE